MTQEVLLEIREIIARIHDRRLTHNSGLDLIELAALRDCVNRINNIIKEDPYISEDASQANLVKALP